MSRYRGDLKVGDRISKGSIIGYVGSTGRRYRPTPTSRYL